MTREEAIRCLSVHSSTNGSGLCTDEQHYEAKQMAIKALEQEPCEDAISRQALLDDFGFSEKTRKWGGDHSGYNTMMLYEIQNVIESQPPVKPQERTGHWFVDERPESDREIICSNCEQPILKYHKLDFDYRPKYCPNCGAKMIEPQESEG